MPALSRDINDKKVDKVFRVFVNTSIYEDKFIYEFMNTYCSINKSINTYCSITTVIEQINRCNTVQVLYEYSYRELAIRGDFNLKDSATPAVHDDGPGVRAEALLHRVHLVQEAEHDARVGGHAVVGPLLEQVVRHLHRRARSPSRAATVRLHSERTLAHELTQRTRLKHQTSSVRANIRQSTVKFTKLRILVRLMSCTRTFSVMYSYTQKWKSKVSSLKSTSTSNSKVHCFSA